MSFLAPVAGIHSKFQWGYPRISIAINGLRKSPLPVSGDMLFSLRRRLRISLRHLAGFGDHPAIGDWSDIGARCSGRKLVGQARAQAARTSVKDGLHRTLTRQHYRQSTFLP
jgi:hypothetical protein